MKSIFKDKLKLCKKCGQFKPLKDFHFTYTHYKNYKKIRHKSSPCKECCGKRSHKRYQNLIKLISWLPERQIIAYKANSKRRNLVFDLDLKYFKWVNKQPCYYCGYIPKEYQAMGIDRVVNEIGYTKENCVPCCEICNRAKLQMNDKEYIGHCKKVAEKHSLITNTNPLNKGVS